MTLDQMISTAFEGMTQPMMLGVIVCALIYAFFGLRLFKLSMMLSAGYAGYVVGAVILGGYISNLIGGYEWILGAAFAIIFAAIAVRIFKLIFTLLACSICAAIGFVIPYFIVTAFASTNIAIIAGVVGGIAVVVVFTRRMLRVFKIILMFLISLMSSSLAVILVLTLLFGAGFEVFVALVTTIILTVASFAVQKRMNKRRDLF